MAELMVLIVEDEPDSAEIIESLLAYYQVGSYRVASAEDAFIALQDQSYDAIIVDLFLPGMDGVELLRSIRNTPELANIPSIAITAYGSSTMRKQALEAGYDCFYIKPIDHRELSQGLRELLS